MGDEDIKPEVDDDNLSIVSKGPPANQPPWDAQYEKVLIEWADKAQCYRWLHGRSFAQYRRKAMWYTIPVIIMSTITGTANFAQERFPLDIKPIAVIAIGSVNLIAGIITTISQYLKVNELLESHRVANLSWDKFVRDVKMELAKDPREHGDVPGQREPPITCMTKFKETFDRLMEVSPNIEDDVIAEFAFRFDDDKIRITKELKARKQRILYGDESGDGVAPWLRPCVKCMKCYDCFADPKEVEKRRLKQEEKDREVAWKAANPRKSIRDFYDLEAQLFPKNTDQPATPKSDNIAQKVKDEITKKNKSAVFLRKPDILGELNSVELDVHPWRAQEEEKKLNGPDLEAKALAKAELERDAKLQQRRNNQDEVIRQQVLAQEEEAEKIEFMKIKESIANRITTYITKFKAKWHRVPLVDDVIEALSDIDEDEIRSHDLLIDKENEYTIA
jgi:hypothetical protein